MVPRLLADGHEVTVLDNLSRGGAGLLPVCGHPNFEFVRGQCFDEDVLQPLLDKADAVIPLAGVVGLTACDRDPDNAWKVNSQAIRMLLARRRTGQLLLFPMTNSGYGRTAPGKVCDEDTPLEPVSVYGKSKKMAEEMVLDSPNTVSFRLATVFGVSPAMRWDLLVNDFTRRAVQDRAIVLFEGHARRNYVHVQDVADCFAWAVRSSEMNWCDVTMKMVGKPWNLGNDSANCTKLEMARKVYHIVGEPFVIHEAIHSNDPDKRDYEVSSARLRATGFEAKRSLEDGIKEVAKAVQLL
jgi:nucleoside-diphosphate-sugar epimerase